MPPNNQYPQNPTPPSGNFDSSQFDFIMNSGPQKKSFLSNGSPKQKIILVIVFIGAVLSVLAVIMAMLFGGGNENVDKLVSIAKQQNEIIRIADLGRSSAANSDAKKIAAISWATVSSDQLATVSYLGTQGKKLKEKELALGQDAKADEALESATSNGRFDEVFTDIMLEKLKTYQADLQSAFNSSGQKGKAVLEKDFNNVSLIIEDFKPSS